MQRTFAPGAATGAMEMAAVARPRVGANGSCPSVSYWFSIDLGTTRKHAQPRRTKASP
jgi:hypothetical protein